MKVKIAVATVIVMAVSGFFGYQAQQYIEKKEEFFDAVRAGDLPSVEKSLKSGIDIDARDGAGQTALHIASYKGNEEMVKFLLAKKSPLDARDNRGGTPLHWAVIKGKIDAAELLIKAGANVNAQDKPGDTPLHWLVASRGVIDIKRFVTASYLLKQNADPNIRNEQGKTPLDLAQQKNDQVMIRLLKPETGK